MPVLRALVWLNTDSFLVLESEEAFGVLLGYSLEQLRALTVTDLEVGLTLQPTSAIEQRSALYQKSDGSFLKMSCCTRHIEDKGGQYFTFLHHIDSSNGYAADRCRTINAAPYTRGTTE
ncbi:MAG: hypothetical protein V2B20_18245 [Pseudomonadota bacterium]